MVSFKLLLLYPWRYYFQYPFDGKLLLCRREKSLNLAQNRTSVLQVVAGTFSYRAISRRLAVHHITLYVFTEHCPVLKPIAATRYGGREGVSTVFWRPDTGIMGLSLSQGRAVFIIFVCYSVCSYRPCDGPIAHPERNAYIQESKTRKHWRPWTPLTRKVPWNKKVMRVQGPLSTWRLVEKAWMNVLAFSIPNRHTIIGCGSISLRAVQISAVRGVSCQIYALSSLLAGKDPHSNYWSAILCCGGTR